MKIFRRVLNKKTTCNCKPVQECPGNYPVWNACLFDLKSTACGRTTFNYVGDIAKVEIKET